MNMRRPFRSQLICGDKGLRSGNLISSTKVHSSGSCTMVC